MFRKVIDVASVLKAAMLFYTIIISSSSLFAFMFSIDFGKEIEDI